MPMSVVQRKLACFQLGLKLRGCGKIAIEKALNDSIHHGAWNITEVKMGGVSHCTCCQWISLASWYVALVPLYYSRGWTQTTLCSRWSRLTWQLNGNPVSTPRCTWRPSASCCCSFQSYSCCLPTAQRSWLTVSCHRRDTPSRQY